MSEIWTMGEILVEIMRPEVDMPLDRAGQFLGPFPSGAPAIFIDAAARLGHSAGIIGGVGQDGFGDNCLTRLRRDGVNCEFVNVVPNRSTAVAFVAYFGDGSRRFIYHIDGTPAVQVNLDGLDRIQDARFLHIMGCSLMINDTFRAQIFEVAEHFYRHGAQISFDPNVRPELLAGRDILDVVGPILEKSSILLPGISELKLVTGQDDLAGAVKRAFANPILQTIVLKRGKAGCTVYTREEELTIPAYAVEEVDPTGAGDCFDAGFLCGLLEGRSLLECGQMAAAAGALNAQAFGPMEGAISPESVRALMG